MTDQVVKLAALMIGSAIGVLLTIWLYNRFSGSTVRFLGARPRAVNLTIGEPTIVSRIEEV